MCLSHPCFHPRFLGRLSPGSPPGLSKPWLVTVTEDLVSSTCFPPAFTVPTKPHGLPPWWVDSGAGMSPGEVVLLRVYFQVTATLNLGLELTTQRSMVASSID